MEPQSLRAAILRRPASQTFTLADLRNLTGLPGISDPPPFDAGNAWTRRRLLEWIDGKFSHQVSEARLGVTFR